MVKKCEEIWGKCLQIIKDNVPKVSYQTWFEPIVPLDINDKVLAIQVPSEFFYEFIEENFLDLLKKTLNKVMVWC